MHPIKTKAQKKKEKAALEKKEKRLEKLAGGIFVILTVGLILYYCFFKPCTIGYDQKYFVYVILLPAVTGTVSLLFFGRKIIKEIIELPYNTIQLFMAKVYWVLAATSVIIAIPLLFLGSIGDVIFETVNYNVAKNHKSKIVILHVNHFYESHNSKYSNRIEFRFNGHYESIKVGDHFINKCIIQQAEKHLIKLTVRKGIWNYYLVESFDIVK